MSGTQLDEKDVSPGTGEQLAPEKRKAVLEQLERMLSHSTFRKSFRCRSLMRYVVEQTLKDQSVHIKERTIGVEVFERDPDYDTALDPVVRTAAIETRKRIAQYFHEAGHEAEVQIELHSGSYTPEFTFLPKLHDIEQAPAGRSLLTGDSTLQLGESPAKSFRRHYLITIAMPAVFLILVLLFGIWSEPRLFPSNANRFWTPIWASPGRVLIEIGKTGYWFPNTEPDMALKGAKGAAIEQLLDQAPSASSPGFLRSIQTLPLIDSDALAKIASVLEKNNKTHELRIAADTKFSDLRGGPLILIGGFNNSWTLRLTDQLRYHFVIDPQSHSFMIEDKYHPENKSWSIRIGQNPGDYEKDFAIVSRYSEGETGTIVVEVAGLGAYGTETAAEFLTNPIYLDSLGKRMAGCERNVQFVLQANIIDHTPGPPNVLAMNCW